MRVLDRLSIKQKLMSIIMITSTVALLMACVGFIAYDLLSFRSALGQELLSLAEIVGKNCAAALTFEDQEAAKSTLSSLTAKPNVEEAAIYTTQSTVFATYSKGGSHNHIFPSSIGEENSNIKGEYLIVFKKIHLDGELFGTVYLKSNLDQFYSRLKRYIMIVSILLITSLLVAFFVSTNLQKLISRPILDLAHVARTVTENHDFSARASIETQDEVGMLIDDFNEMLSQIQSRDRALQNARDELEKRVQERTQNLRREIAERKKAEEEIRLLQSLTFVVGQAEDVDGALSMLLQKLCKFGEWALGQAWIPSADNKHLICSSAYFALETGLDKFRSLSKDFQFQIGVGLPGRVWASKKSAWISDVTQDSNFPRAPIAREVQLKSGVGIPVLADDKVVAVLEFFMREVRPENERIIELATSFSTQLGSLILRKKAEQEVKSTLSLLTATLESTGDGILVVDKEGKMVSFNQQFLRMWNIPGSIAGERDDDKALGFVLGQLRDPDQFIAKVKELYAQPNADSYDVLEFKDDRIFERHSQPQRFGNEVVGRVWCFRDITERMRLESQFRQSQKMEAVGQLAGGVAHDFNNLLTVLIGYAEELISRIPEDSPFQKELNAIKRASNRAAGLTRQLLAFSRRQVLQPKILNLNTVVSEMQKMLRRLIGEHIELLTKLSPTLGAIKADPGQLEQVLMNLAVNARDAMPDGGKLIIETANVELGQSYTEEHFETKPGQYVMLAVSDNGTGMDAETKRRVFEPFFTTKGVGKGTGLGLSTVYGIIRQSEGYISVYSELGKGTTFKIYLPRMDEASENSHLEETNSERPLGSETILLVEDEEEVRAFASGVLTRLGYNVLPAENGSHALSVSENHSGPIHLVLTDVVMPKMGGPELAKRLTVTRPEVKLLFMSGYTDDFAIHQRLLKEDSAFLQKPFTPLSLSQKVREVLDSKTESTS